MNTSRKKYNVIILLSFFSAFCFLGCNEEETEPTGELVKQSLCLHESLDSRDDVTPTNQDCIKYEYDGESTLLLKHLNAGFNCCPDKIITVISIVNNTIRITESQAGGFCKCECLYDLDYKIIHLPPGKYKVVVDEPLVVEGGEKLEFEIDLSSSTSGRFCVERTHYPWGEEDDFCLDNSECDSESYCKKEIGDCEGRGQCDERPDACIEIYDPVCGCDGITYGNACMAEAAGVNGDYEGECKQPPPEEPKGELLKWSSCKNDLNDTDAVHIPSDKDCLKYRYDGENTLILNHLNAGFNCCPDTIEAIFDFTDNTILIKESETGGVCDCECLYDLYFKIMNLPPGKYKIVVEEPLVREGDEKLEFEIDLTSHASGLYCVERTHYPWEEGDDFCLDNKDCDFNSYCQKAPGHCDGKGECSLKPQACIQVYDPVCGCDGKTYGNACDAAASGVNVDYKGECNPILIIKEAKWSTHTKRIGNLVFGYVDLFLAGRTTGNKVTVQTYGDGVISQHPLKLCNDGTFSETVTIAFTHQAGPEPFSMSTFVTAYDDNGSSKSIELESGELVYITDCEPVMCELLCKYGFKLDENGCETCECNDRSTMKIDVTL